MDIIQALPSCIAAGFSHQLFLDSEGKVYRKGENLQNQFSLQGILTKVVPTLVGGLPVIKSVHAAESNSLFIDCGGNVYGWGDNNNHELGLEVFSVKTPTQIKGIPPMQTIVMVQHHTLFLDFEGNVWRCGKHMGTYKKSPEIIPGLPVIISITNNYTKYFLLQDNGLLWSYSPFDEPSQYGRGKQLPRMISIFNSVGVDANGNVWSLFYYCKVNLIKFKDIFIHIDGSTWQAKEPNQGTQFVADIETKFTRLPLPTIHALAVGSGSLLMLDGEGAVWEIDSSPLTKPKRIKNLPIITRAIGNSIRQLKSARNL